jgi:hypothetical protein
MYFSKLFLINHLKLKKTAETSKNNLTLFFILSFILLSIYNANSQTVYYDTINKQKYVLIDIRKTYERVIDKGYESIEMFEYLGNYYYDCKNFEKSKLYFDKLFRKYKLSDISSKSIEQYKILGN